MGYNIIGGFPTQQLPLSRKNRKWRMGCVDFADNHSYLHNHAARKSFQAMRTNYDLLNGILHIEDMKAIVNPYGIDASFIPDNIQHYSMINAYMRVLEGEESRRLFDYRVVVTNPTAISEIEEEKNKLINEKLQQLIADTSQNEEEYQNELQKISDYFTYEYQDKREVRANRILNHYSMEQDFPIKFNKGFKDGYAVGEELFRCDIVGGEPVLERLNPEEVIILRSGTSTNVEDADMIIIDQYWSPGKVVEVYWDQLTPKQIQKIEEGSYDGDGSTYDSMGNIDARYYNVLPQIVQTTAGDVVLNPHDLFDENPYNTGLPYDINGNVRVLRVYWKSRRRIKKVKSYDPETGEEVFNFYNETYHCDPDKGEEESIFWINEAWEGTKIADDIYVNMRPRPVQYNRLSNPSRCHFGIVGSIYTSNGDEPYSMVDIMKPYAYLYDAIHDKLNKIISRNVGKVIRLDFAKVPKGWDPDKWLYFLNVNGVAVEDSAKEGTGIMQGKPVGALNNATSGVVDASLGNEIISLTSLLDWIDTHCGKLVGMTPQRMGQVANRETVGGVERATLQSSHSTEWLFFIHESVKKRVLECFIETAKIALKGRKKKFEFILEDGSIQIEEVDGDEFAECDYGLVVDNSNGTQELNQKLDMLAQAGLQNGMGFSTVMKLYTTKSLAEKQRTVENDEKRRLEMQQQQQQREFQLQQLQIQSNQQIAQQRAELEYKMHQEKLENNLLVAEINASAETARLSLMNHDNDEANTIEREKIAENARQFDAKLALEKKAQQDDARLKEKQINKQTTKKN